MATIIPSIASCKDVTPDGHRFARLLEAKLEDDYLLEEKDWRLSTIHSINNYGGAVAEQAKTDVEVAKFYVAITRATPQLVMTVIGLSQ